MSTLVVVGAQWGDEGKGKVVDVLAAQADLVARFSGGNNAGHTLVVDGQKIVTHLVPSGCTYPGTPCYLGAGMVVDPDVFAEEIAEIQGQGLLGQGELRVSAQAHLIFPWHRELDGAREDRAAGAKIGTTRRGIGPAYEAKAGRRGIRMGDLLKEDRLRSRLQRNLEVVNSELESLGSSMRLDIESELERARGWRAWLEPMICDTGAEIDAAIRSGKRVLLEGAQGAMLDLDHGTYPYVTSSGTLAGTAAGGLGIGPTAIDEVWGITKAYTTRVGAGPFPTRLDGEAGEALRQAGGEFGATTGRPRDCGWLDLPALSLAARLNGMTGLCLTKVDVLAQLPRVQICERYEDDLQPGLEGFEEARPVFRELEGWGDPAVVSALASARTRADLPVVVRAYIDLIEERIGVPITLLSVGPGRDETLRFVDAFPGT